MMDKLDMLTTDKVDENIKKIGNLFPNCITETVDENGKPVKAIDFDMLKQELSKVVVDGPKERYQFTWPDKKKSILSANKPISATLRPCREESVNFDKTENLYIEGDNLDVLKILQETYLGKVQMIYIDPPYNTGYDFVYEDKFNIDSDTYKTISGDYDAHGNQLVKNTESNGRFHTDWLNMIYPRLKIARDLLSADGVIFISCDDNELKNVLNIGNELFNEKNYVTTFIWEKKKKPSFLHRNVGKLGDYIVCYTKDNIASKPFSLEQTTEGKKFPFNNAGNGITKLEFPKNSVSFSCQDMHVLPQDMSDGKIITKLLNEFDILNGKNAQDFILEGEWRYSQKMLEEIVKNKETITISKIPFRPNHVKSGGEIKKMKNFFTPKHYEMDTNEDASAEIIDLFSAEVFDTPKPVKLIKTLIKAVTYDNPNAIIMDFFSGSATTAHAVLELNKEEGTQKKYILVQLQEDLDKAKSKAPSNMQPVFDNAIKICDEISVPHLLTEIGKERIRRAGKKVKEEAGLNGQDLDIGFRVLKIDSSNMKNVYYSPEEYVNTPELFDKVHDNIKEDRSGEDLLFQVMLDLGIELSADIKTETIGGKNIYSVKDNYLVACFENDVTDDILTQIAKRKPFYAVLRDISFTRDDTASNFEQIFATWSPETIKKVL